MEIRYCPECGRKLHLREQQDAPPAPYCDGCGAEAAVCREIREELGMTALAPRFLGSHYYVPSETLMLNFLAAAAEEQASPNAEVDSWEWVPVEDTLSLVNPGDLAETFLLDYEEYRRLP